MGPYLGQFHMLERCGDPVEVAAAILFLLSDDASFITAADLPVDGGYQGMGSEGLGRASWGFEQRRIDGGSFSAGRDGDFIISEDIRERIYRSDYHLSPVLWSLPSAIMGQDIHAACAKDRLIWRIVEAGKGPAFT